MRVCVDGGDVAGLNLDEEVAALDVHNEAIDGLFLPVARLSVPGLECCVERPLLHGANAHLPNPSRP